ncbi:cysteine-rich motor neuron 1 protein-like isoform X3 [Sardina pilchardus]|uniref:cysteine-rich motor neuron 1 protein-like isoform X3 n=1 Tax=Sardina pilchardus TaxID=27697 RepID=UPI002E138700
MICLSLWLWWTLLRGCCQTEETVPILLGQGQPCGVDIEGVCGANLTCVTGDGQASATGVCTTPLDTDCVPCASVQCPPTRRVCPGGHVTEPCGCCPHCARQHGQLCGGPHWSRGYCDRDLTCSQITGLLPATPPHTGVCKGCNVRTGACDCYTLQTCHWVFSYRTLEDCLKVMKEDEYYWMGKGGKSEDSEEMEEEEEEEEEEEDCTEWNCEVQEGRCACGERSCDPQTQPLSEEACQDLLLVQANCSNVTCPEVPVPSCPEDSILTQPFILPGSCCPLVPALCTCIFEKCTTPVPTCPPGQQLNNTVKANGFPGSCCDLYLCESSEEEEPQDS